MLYDRLHTRQGIRLRIRPGSGKRPSEPQRAQIRARSYPLHHFVHDLPVRDEAVAKQDAHPGIPLQLQLSQARRVAEHEDKVPPKLVGVPHILGQAVHLVDEADVADEGPLRRLPLGHQHALCAARGEEEGEPPAYPHGLVALAHLLEHSLA
ncbi:unnamed protein product, partial [Clonostachys chloroleuca]